MSDPHPLLTSPHIRRAQRGYWIVGDGMVRWYRTLAEAEAAQAAHGGLADPEAAPIASAPAEPMDTIVYGPVASRRLGRSLGINLSPPGTRVCGFDCIYCEFGDCLERRRGGGWPSPGDVESALANALPEAGRLDSITISGVGEPTLHPRFGAAAAAIVDVAARARPYAPVRILTNGSGALRPATRRALDLLDERIVKFDAAADRVDRPAKSQPLGGILAALALLDDVSLQSCFVAGPLGNLDRDSTRTWAQTVAELQPRRVFIYTIDRPPVDSRVERASPEQLEEVACMLREGSGVEAEVFA